MASDDKNSSVDLLGIKPVGESVKILTEGSVEGAGAFLGRICLPAAEEFGLLLKDQISAWRAANAIKIAEKAEEKLKAREIETGQASPRLIMKAIEEGSWHDEDLFQEAWAGILASSCSEEGKDDSNILFINILQQLTSVQVKIIDFACENAIKKVYSESGWHYCDPLRISLTDLLEMFGQDVDPHRIDRELDFLREQGLIGSQNAGGFYTDSNTSADITPTSLALHLYIRCKGFVGTPSEYWDLEL